MNEKINELVAQAQKIVIIQADNPDGDSLGSALALESILGNQGKDTYMYCGVDMPGYLHHLSGWDRVLNIFPSSFDLSIIVDVSTMTLLEKITESGKQDVLSAKPSIVLDHHGSVENEIPFATVLYNDVNSSSTGELIYNIAAANKWQMTEESGKFMMSAILGDTQGLTNNLASSHTYRVMADLTELGVNRPLLEEQRRETSKMPLKIFKYKAELIERTESHIDGKLALVTIPHDEIMEFSPLYNPAPLIQNDMLQTAGVGVAVVLKHYNDGKILGAIRCNPGYKIGALLAEHFGGGGHPYASGFKIQDGKAIDEVKSEFIHLASELIAKLEEDNQNEAPQYAYTIS